jgi:hypothetical protein
MTSVNNDHSHWREDIIQIGRAATETYKINLFLASYRGAVSNSEVQMQIQVRSDKRVICGLCFKNVKSSIETNKAAKKLGALPMTQ